MNKISVATCTCREGISAGNGTRALGASTMRMVLALTRLPF